MTDSKNKTLTTFKHQKELEAFKAGSEKAPETELPKVPTPTEENIPKLSKLNNPNLLNKRQDFAGKFILDVEDVQKSFQVGLQEVNILKGVSFKVKDGDFMIIFGPSGCGKSTLLNTLLGLEPPTKGKVSFIEVDLYAGTNEDDRAIVRKKHIGMIYQQPNWIKALNVVENVGFPLTLLGMEKEESITKALGMLDQVSMKDWAYYSPTELSSGQQQRVALARALISNPLMIVADEPTGNLDFEAGQIVMKLLSDLNKTDGKTVIMVTHDLEYLKYCKTALRMLDGQVVGIYDAKDHDKIFKDIKYKRGQETNTQGATP